MRTTKDAAFQSETPTWGDRRGPGEGPDRAGDRRHFRHGGFGERGADRGADRGFGGRRGGPGFGPAFERGLGGRGQRARKGDVRAAILSLLSDAPSNGYGLIKSIGEKTDGGWRPSPGSVYPTLAQLVDEELIAPNGAGGPRSEYQLTDGGRTYLAEHADEITQAWAGAQGDPDDRGALFESARKLMGALRQFGSDANTEQRAQAVAKVDELRRELYRILGE